MNCNDDHALGVNFGGPSECGELLRTADAAPYPRPHQTEAQALFDALDHPFRYCPDCGQVNSVFTGLFDLVKK